MIRRISLLFSVLLLSACTQWLTTPDAYKPKVTVRSPLCAEITWRADEDYEYSNRQQRAFIESLQQHLLHHRIFQSVNLSNQQTPLSANQVLIDIYFKQVPRQAEGEAHPVVLEAVLTLYDKNGVQLTKHYSVEMGPAPAESPESDTLYAVTGQQASSELQRAILDNVLYWLASRPS